MSWNEDQTVFEEGEAELVVQTINIAADSSFYTKTISSHSQYKRLLNLTDKLCYKLSQINQVRKNSTKSFGLDAICLAKFLYSL